MNKANATNTTPAGLPMLKKSLDPRAVLPTLVALALTALSSGCSLIPALDRPQAPIAAQWPGTPVTEPIDSTQVLGDWKDYFEEPDLRELIGVALANNRDLRVAALSIEQARAQLGIRQADQFPGLNASVTGNRAPSSSGGTTSSYSGGLMVSAYELDFFGRLASLKEQALAQYLATTEANKTAQISLIATVAQGWLSLLADEELLAVAQQTVTTRQESLQLVSLKARHGAASELDLQLAQTLFESANASLAQYQRQRALDENSLQLVLGQALPDAVRTHLSKLQLSQIRMKPVPAGMPSELLTRRPDIRQAEQVLRANNANIGAARAAFFPRISLTAGAGSASGELSGLFKNGSWGWTVAPQLVLPIFDAGRNQANLQAAKSGKDMAIAQYEKSIQIAFREVSDALAGRDTWARQRTASQASVTAESSRTALTKLRFENGAASQLDWLDAQRSLFTARQGLVQVQLSYLQNQVMLYKSLGGGLAANAAP